MGISVYYNLNHHYFRCNYSPHMFDDEKIDKVDKKNRLFIQLIDTPSKNRSVIRFKKYRLPLRIRISHILLKLANKLANNNSLPPKNNWYMWRKK